MNTISNALVLLFRGLSSLPITPEINIGFCAVIDAVPSPNFQIPPNDGTNILLSEFGVGTPCQDASVKPTNERPKVNPSGLKLKFFSESYFVLLYNKLVTKL